MGPWIPALFLVALAVGGSYLSSGSPTQSMPATPTFNFVVTIVMENNGINATYGSSCKGNCSYITQLANTYSLADNYSAIGHPSLPNYLALAGGGNYDRYPFDTDCYPENLTSGCYVTNANIIDSVTGSGRSWRVYAEDYKGGCSLGAASKYYTNTHNPFVYFTDIYHNSTRCGRIVDADPGSSGFLALPTQLFSDLNSSVAPNYIWLIPNLCNDGHSLCQPLNNTVSQSNLYLSQVVPRILASTLFKTQKAALFITWDEGDNRANAVTTIWAGPIVNGSFKSHTSYNHYSAIKTIELAWNLPTLSTYDAAAMPMTEFFSSAQSSSLGGGGKRFPMVIFLG